MPPGEVVAVKVLGGGGCSDPAKQAEGDAKDEEHERGACGHPSLRSCSVLLAVQGPDHIETIPIPLVPLPLACA